ncbi:hypothetical protein AB4K20DRAFT_1826911 [Rhizopus microsporus]
MSSNSEITLLHSQAACVFFGEDLNAENELMCEWKIDAIPDVKLCYINNMPTEPFLVAKNCIKFFPFRYQLYRRSSSEEAKLPSTSINCESQLLDFVNSVFLTTDPRNEAVYERKEVSSEEIYNITAQYITLYEKKKRAAFTQFATKNGAHFLKAQTTRKRMDSGLRVERKIVYIIKADDRDYAALSTVPADVQALVKSHESLEYIVVDRLKETGRYEVYRRMEILQTADCLDSFNCRKGLPHRSI